MNQEQSSTAPITDATKAVLFDELLNQMAADKVTLLWDGQTSLSGAELVSHLQDANDQRVAAPVEAYQFEAIGYLSQRADFDRLLDSPASDDLAKSLFAALAAQFAEQGFTGLEEVYVTEDDEQRDTDIKCFVCVRLLGRSDIIENEVPPQALADLMAGLGASVCCTQDGTWLLHPEDWELASINEPEDQAG
jgi:hypothetical protein